MRSLARDREAEFEVDDSEPSFVDDRPFNREDVYKNTNYKCAVTDDDQLVRWNLIVVTHKHRYM